ncbi:TPA: thermonuclease family protein [Klebsiella pneumoniae]
MSGANTYSQLNDAFGGASNSLARYGRTLGTVYAKICPPAPCRSVYVNAEQVKAGMAWAYRFHGQAVDPAMLKLETQARSERVGLWSAPNAVEPWKWRHQMESAGK